MIHLLNIYAHSNNVKEREELFNYDLIYYLRNSLDNTILGGDWNCVLSQRDTESVNTNISKAPKVLSQNIQCCISGWVHHRRKGERRRN